MLSQTANFIARPRGERVTNSARSMMHPLQTLDFSTRVAKRAQYEAFEFALLDGNVSVRNGCHLHPDDHEYIVTVEDGLPTACECPADSRFEGACKHLVAVAIRPVVLSTATQFQDGTLATDGGVLNTDETAPSQGNDFDEVQCDECIDDFPCWECYRRGRRDFPTSE